MKAQTKSYSPNARPGFRRRNGTRRREEGSILVAVMIVMIFLAAGLGTYLGSLSNIEHLQDQRVMDDRALMAAEAGLAKAIVQLQAMATPPITNQIWNEDVPAAQFAPFQSVTVNIYPRAMGSQLSWTLASTATSAAGSRMHAICRRVQTSLFQENFAKYEYFVNDFGGVWQPGYFQFEGFGSVFLGPYHCNSGVAFWPNLWAVNDATTAASGGVRYFADYNSYKSIYGQSDANNYVNILQYYSSTFKNAPQFYKGLNVLPQPVSMPTDMNVDTRSQQLRSNAGLILPLGYVGFDPTKGSDFAIALDPAGGAANDGKSSCNSILV